MREFSCLHEVLRDRPVLKVSYFGYISGSWYLCMRILRYLYMYVLWIGSLLNFYTPKISVRDTVNSVLLLKIFYDFKEHKPIQFIFAMSSLLWLWFLFFQDFTEIGINMHRIHQWSVSSGPQNKFLLASVSWSLLFWNKPLSCQRCFYGYLYWKKRRKSI